MGWTPSEVRACSPADFVAALDGYLRARGIDQEEVDSGLTADDVRELQALGEITA